MIPAPGDPRERWRRVSEIFNEALALPAHARSPYIDEASQGDPEMATEVRSLLGAHERSGDFIESPVVVQAELDAIARSVSPAGRQIGHYTIRRVLGEGGMGVVYLAHDTRLNRDVALKALALRFIGNAGRADRLRREARAAASLAHAGVATVYALEEIDGQLYIASEYVPGQTLREALAAGPLAPTEVIRIARAIADALSAAHGAGIVHRDLKPKT